MGSVYGLCCCRAVKTLRSPNLLTLTQNAKDAFKAGPDQWKKLRYSAFYVTEHSYGGYFNGGQTILSTTSSSTRTFQAAAEVATAYDVGAVTNYTKTREEYASSNEFRSDTKCSPAACLEHSPSDDGPKEVKQAYEDWYGGVRSSGGKVIGIRVASLKSNDEILRLYREDQDGWGPFNTPKWTQSSFNELFDLPGPLFMAEWNKAKFTSMAKLNDVDHRSPHANDANRPECAAKYKNQSVKMRSKWLSIEENATLAYLNSQESKFANGETLAWKEVEDLYGNVSGTDCECDFDCLSGNCIYPKDDTKGKCEADEVTECKECLDAKEADRKGRRQKLDVSRWLELPEQA